MSASVQRLVAAILLLGWIAPGVSALGVGIHLESAHDEDHAAKHRNKIAELLGSAAHGHHHDLETDPKHDHEVRFEGAARTVRVGLEAMESPSPAGTLGQWIVRLSPLDSVQRRGPPRERFAAHCALLI